MKQVLIPSLLVLTLASCNNDPVRIVDFENEPVRHLSTQSFSMDEVQIDIRMALGRKGWSINPGETQGHLTATKHDEDASATIDLTYNLFNYSIRYKASSGLDYQNSCQGKEADGKVRIDKNCIKPSYNEWVKELNTELSGKLEY